jgi:hypothetical protein
MGSVGEGWEGFGREIGGGVGLAVGFAFGCVFERRGCWHCQRVLVGILRQVLWLARDRLGYLEVVAL